MKGTSAHGTLTDPSVGATARREALWCQGFAVGDRDEERLGAALGAFDADAEVEVWSGAVARGGAVEEVLPDIDVDVESARRTEIYDAILNVFGGDRVACVAMMETYRVRHAIRDVGAALSLPPHEVDAMAKAFPHIAARNARAAIVDLPELGGSRKLRDAGLPLFTLVDFAGH